MGSFLETASAKETMRIETAPSETVTVDSAYRFIYIDEPIFGRADTNDDGDFNDSEEQFYYTSNNLYCVTALLDTSGNIIERYEYTPYGELTVYTDDGGDSDWWDGDETTGSLSGNYYTFTGRRSDPESGWMYFRNRYYSAGLGRFPTRDPLYSYPMRTQATASELSVHLYDYILNRPTFAADPLGLHATESTWHNYLHEIGWVDEDHGGATEEDYEGSGIADLVIDADKAGVTISLYKGVGGGITFGEMCADTCGNCYRFVVIHFGGGYEVGLPVSVGLSETTSSGYAGPEWVPDWLEIGGTLELGAGLTGAGSAELFPNLLEITDTVGIKPGVGGHVSIDFRVYRSKEAKPCVVLICGD